jgi:hypothetical protein
MKSQSNTHIHNQNEAASCFLLAQPQAQLLRTVRTCTRCLGQQKYLVLMFDLRRQPSISIVSQQWSSQWSGSATIQAAAIHLHLQRSALTDCSPFCVESVRHAHRHRPACHWATEKPAMPQFTSRRGVLLLRKAACRYNKAGSTASQLAESRGCWRKDKRKICQRSSKRPQG